MQLKTFTRCRRPSRAFRPYVCHGEGSGTATDTLATEHIKSKHAAAT